MHSISGESGIEQSLAIHRALRVLPPNKRSNRASSTMIESVRSGVAHLASLMSFSYRDAPIRLLPDGTLM